MPFSAASSVCFAGGRSGVSCWGSWVWGKPLGPKFERDIWVCLLGLTCGVACFARMLSLLPPGTLDRSDRVTCLSDAGTRGFIGISRHPGVSPGGVVAVSWGRSGRPDAAQLLDGTAIPIPTTTPLLTPYSMPPPAATPSSPHQSRHSHRHGHLHH